IGTATGSLFGGLLTASLQKSAMTPVASQRAAVLLYAAMGLVLAALFTRLSSGAEVHRSSPRSRGVMRLLGIGESRTVVLRLGALFALDAFGGGFVVQSFAAYWFYLRFGVSPKALGGIFFGANLLAGI